MNDSDRKVADKPVQIVGWAVENAMKINPGESKAVSFTRARVKFSLNYFLGDQRIPEASSCQYLGIIIRSDLSWVDQVNYTVKTNLEGTSFHTVYSQKGK